MLKNRRLINFAGFVACVGAPGVRLYTQYELGLEPCPLCIFQRVGIAALGVVFLIAALHNPQGWGTRVYAVLIAVAALATVGVAARHVYVQHLPPGSLPSCGAPLGVLLKFTPVLEVIRKVLTGSGECSEVHLEVPRPRDAGVGADLRAHLAPSGAARALRRQRCRRA